MTSLIRQRIRRRQAVKCFAVFKFSRDYFNNSIPVQRNIPVALSRYPEHLGIVLEFYRSTVRLGGIYKQILAVTVRFYAKVSAIIVSVYFSRLCADIHKDNIVAAAVVCIRGFYNVARIYGADFDIPVPVALISSCVVLKLGSNVTPE